MTPDEILASPNRVHCLPFPDMDLWANLSERACLCNQTAGRMIACTSCPTGLKIRRKHPSLFTELQKSHRPSNWGGTGVHEYQQVQRGKIAASVGEVRARGKGAR